MKRLQGIRVLAIGLAFVAAPARAQDVVPVNLYVADIVASGTDISIANPVKLTGDRGVSSQPSFAKDGKSVLFIGRRDSANAQSDVYRIDLATLAETRVTATPEMENSPTMTPDGKLMVIRWVPATLFTEWGPWIYEMNGTPVKGVLPGPDTVGYYVQVDSTTYAMMRPTSRRAVAVFDTRTGRMTDRDWSVATLPPQLIPGSRAVSYTVVDSSGRNVIRKLDISSGSATTIAPALVGRVVHAWTPRGILLMGKGNRIYARNPSADTAWRAVAAFADPELQSVSTYVVSPAGDKVILISPVKPALHTVIRDSLLAGRTIASALEPFRGATAATLSSRFEVSEGGIAALGAEVAYRSPAEIVRLRELNAALHPLSFAAQRQLGAAYRRSGDEARALEAFRRSLELNPRVTDAEKQDAAATERQMSQPAPAR